MYMTDTVKRKSGERPEGERVAKVIARAGLASRRDVEAWIAEGRVSVNGGTIRSPALNVTPRDRIAVDGQPLPSRERTRLFLYHKPRGLVTTSRDPEGRRTIFDALPPDLPRVVSIGRLDINTEGLLLLTNDGGLARTLELPATGWLRRYRVRAHGAVTQADLDALKAGVTIDGIHYGAIDATLDREQGANVWLTFGIREGKNREVRRVLEHLGLQVGRLIRLSYGPFQLGELSEGSVEEIRSRVLRDQLGEALVAQAGADFSGPAGAGDERPRPPRESAGEGVSRHGGERRGQASQARGPKDRGPQDRGPRDRGTKIERAGHRAGPDRTRSDRAEARERPPRERRPDASSASRPPRPARGRDGERSRPYRDDASPGRRTGEETRSHRSASASAAGRPAQRGRDSRRDDHASGGEGRFGRPHPPRPDTPRGSFEGRAANRSRSFEPRGRDGLADDAAERRIVRERPPGKRGGAWRMRVDEADAPRLPPRGASEVSDRKGRRIAVERAAAPAGDERASAGKPSAGKIRGARKPGVGKSGDLRAGGKDFVAKSGGRAGAGKPASASKRASGEPRGKRPYHGRDDVAGPRGQSPGRPSDRGRRG